MSQKIDSEIIKEHYLKEVECIHTFQKKESISDNQIAAKVDFLKGLK